jgi:adenylate cyclase
MSESNAAVFLSYASEDAGAAQRICESLRAGGIEVWFDQSELRGGDVWDAAIRKQIKACALFMPIISANSHAREEGYFRLEWKLAVDRSHLMASEKAFLLPVVVDATHDADARVPDKFREVQWTRLPEGKTPPAFVERVLRLLSPHETAATTFARPPAFASTVPGAAPASVRAAHIEARSIQNPSSRSRFALWLIGAVLAIAVGYFAVGRFGASKHVGETARTSATAAAALSPATSRIPEKSIAVLPFVDMSEKKDQEYFSDGLAEELIDLLAKVPDLRVPARTSSFYFKGQHATIAEIAKALGVAQVLEGSVRKAGNTIRVTAQLVRADNGYHLWSETYDRDLKDVFKVQDEIAGAVVSALKLKLAPGQQAPNAHRTANTEAYNQFLLGRQFFDRATLDAFHRSIENYRKAIELDPGYAAAYAGLAMSEAYAADRSGDPAGLQRAVAAAEKAVELSPDQADGYAARGFIRSTINLDRSGAQTDFEKALALDPSDSTVQRRYGGVLASIGRLPEAIAAAKKASELDPLSNSAWSTLGHLLICNRQFAAAREATRRALEIQPDAVFALNDLGRIDLLEGNAAEALAVFRKDSLAGLRLAGIAMAEHTLGHANESQQVLNELIAKDAQDAAYQIAETYAWRGEKDQAFQWLERAYKQRDGGLADVLHDMVMVSLYDDPRFPAMVKKLQLSH